MPAKSKSQQRFMGMVHALQKGELSPSKVSDKVKDAADNMSDSDSEDFASTKHAGKPEKVAKEVIQKIREALKEIGRGKNLKENQKRQATDIAVKFDKAYLNFSREIRDIIKMVVRITGNNTDGKIFDTAYKKHLIPFNKLFMSWYKGQQDNPHIDEGVKAQKAYNNIHKVRNEFIERYSKLRKQLNTLKTESPNNEILRLEKQLYKFEMAFIEQSSKLLGSVSKIAQSNLTEATSSKDLFSGYKVAKWEVYVADEKGKEKIMKVAKSKRAGVILYNKLINSDNYHEVGMRVVKESVNEARLDPKQLLQQLGGNRFIAMTGAKNLAIDKPKNELHMKIGRNSKGVSHVRIKLTSADLYNMEFLQVRAGKIKIKSKEKGVYADQLGKMFKKNTGMNVSLR